MGYRSIINKLKEKILQYINDKKNHFLKVKELKRGSHQIFKSIFEKNYGILNFIIYRLEF